MIANFYMLGALMLYRVCRHVYSTDIITVDQGRCEKWGMKLTKEVANPRCLSYSICNPAVFSLSTRTRQRVLTFGGPRQEVVTKKNTVSRSRSARSRTSCPVSIRDLEGHGKDDLGIEGDVVTCKLYLGLAFTILNLERVTIGYCEVGGGGGGGGWLVVSVLFVVMVLIEELEVLIVELFVDLFVGLFVVVFVEGSKCGKYAKCNGGGVELSS
ncbi:hypothetical protein Tco_0126644 [Tanacetum coccineum]